MPRRVPHAQRLSGLSQELAIAAQEPPRRQLLSEGGEVAAYRICKAPLRVKRNTQHLDAPGQRSRMRPAPLRLPRTTEAAE